MANFIYRSCEFKKVGEDFLHCLSLSDSFFSSEKKACLGSIEFVSYLNCVGDIEKFQIYSKPLRFEYHTILGEYVDKGKVIYFGVKKHVVL